MKTEENIEDFTPVFVLGMPRSGTTVTNALLCTPHDCNDLLPEHHYLGGLAQTISAAFTSFAKNTKHFFPDRDSFVADHMAFMRKQLSATWHACDCPSMLVIKHVKFSHIASLLLEHIPNAKIVAVGRDPRDIFASMLKANEPDWREDEVSIKNFLNNYHVFYGSILRAYHRYGPERVFLLQLENLSEAALKHLGKFMGTSLNPERLWCSSAFDINTLQDHRLFSDLWGKPLSVTGCTKHTDFLSPESASKLSLGSIAMKHTYEYAASLCAGERERRAWVGT